MSQVPIPKCGPPCASKALATRPKCLRIAYLSGPVDARGVYKAWAEGREQAYFGTSYLSQYYQVCSKLDADGYVTTIHAGPEYRTQCGRFLVDNRPLPEGLRGVFYHVGMMLWIVRWVPRLLNFGPDLLIVTALQNYWFCLFFLSWIGIKVVPSVHCVFWPRLEPMKWHWQLLSWLNRNMFWWQVQGAMGVSNDIAMQLQQLTKRPVRTFMPTYSPSQFAQIDPPIIAMPFRIFFAGRIERNKGIYDLLAIADRLDREVPGDFYFDICGEGSELASIQTYTLPKNFIIHGVCSPPKLLDLLGRSHVVVVPTKTSFEEGFNKVCAEAVLAGRPVITSAVCPALATIREAAVEVMPDDIDGYYRAILRLRDDPVFYEQKRRACEPLKAEFYDENNSWGAHLSAVLKDCGHD